MYICCDRYNNPIGRAKTEKEAQEICATLGSSYMKIIPILFWIMRNYNRFYTYSTTFGFLTYKEAMQKVKGLVKEKYNTDGYISFEQMLPILEEMFGDYTYTFLKRKLNKFSFWYLTNPKNSYIIKVKEERKEYVDSRQRFIV